MVDEMTSNFRLLLALVVTCVLPAVASAHVLDEYLQTTLVLIEPGDIRLRINLTPGVEVADKILAQIDVDQNAEITEQEIAAYVKVLRKDLNVQLDGQEVELTLTASKVPKLAELRTGHGIIQLQFSLPTQKLDSGAHTLAFANKHFGDIGAYLLNAARPESDAIQITKQDRTKNQSQGEIHFTFAPLTFASSSAGDASSADPSTGTSSAGKAAGFALSLTAACLAIISAVVWRKTRHAK